jgi:hypothetical protein
LSLLSAEEGWKMARQDEKSRLHGASEPVATLILLMRDSLDALFKETEAGIDIFSRDDFYFGRGESWYLQCTFFSFFEATETDCTVNSNGQNPPFLTSIYTFIASFMKKMKLLVFLHSFT